MRVERIAHADGEKVVDDDVTRGGYPKADDVVDVKSVEGCAVDARNRVGKNEAAENEVQSRPDKSPDQIPQCDVKRRLEPSTDRDQELAGGYRGDDENGDLRKEREFAGFQSVVGAEHQPDQAGQQGDVPHERQRDAQLAPIDPNAAQTRHQIVALADEQIGEGAEDHAIDVDGTESAEGQFQTMAEVVGEGEQARNDHTDHRPDHQPEHSPIKPGSNDPTIDQRIEVDAGESALQYHCGLCQGAPLPIDAASRAARLFRPLCAALNRRAAACRRRTSRQSQPGQAEGSAARHRQKINTYPDPTPSQYSTR